MEENELKRIVKELNLLADKRPLRGSDVERELMKELKQAGFSNEEISSNEEYEMGTWEELIGAVQSVTQFEEIIKVTLTMDSFLSLKLPKNKISGDLPQPGK